jgi:hypothetical protein
MTNVERCQPGRRCAREWHPCSRVSANHFQSKAKTSLPDPSCGESSTVPSPGPYRTPTHTYDHDIALHNTWQTRSVCLSSRAVPVALTSAITKR